MREIQNHFEHAARSALRPEFTRRVMLRVRHERAPSTSKAWAGVAATLLMCSALFWRLAPTPPQADAARTVSWQYFLEASARLRLHL